LILNIFRVFDCQISFWTQVSFNFRVSSYFRFPGHFSNAFDFCCFINSLIIWLALIFKALLTLWRCSSILFMVHKLVTFWLVEILWFQVFQ
jgi:hypothetical protein